MDLAGGVNQILVILTTYWYIFLIIILAIVVLILVLKLFKMRRETHNEIKRHHKELSQEEKYNKSWYKFVYSGNNLKGKLMSIKIKNHSEYEKKRDEFGRMKKTDKPIKSVDFAVIRMKTSKFGFGKDFSLFWNTESFCFPYELIKHDNENKFIIIDSEVNIDKYKGYRIPSNFEHEFTRKFIDSEFSKLEMDYEINAHANQLIKFSSIHHEYGHDVRMKEKEAEIERAKKERKRIS